MYNLVFSDGTGQRGVRNDGVSSNVYKLFLAARQIGGQNCFYDAGVGADPEDPIEAIGAKLFNLYAKATGRGITQNIRECYNFLIRSHRPDSRIGLFGFSRGAYTVRSVGGVLALCGIPDRHQGGIDLADGANPQSNELRSALVHEAVAIYQTGDGESKQHERTRLAQQYRENYRCSNVAPHVIGAFDTVAALGLPGLMDIFNPFKHRFHDTTLSSKVPFGIQALSVDENRRVFKPVLWDDAPVAGDQDINQQWFPGVHSDVGGGYQDARLSDFTLTWMASQCAHPDIAIEFDLSIAPPNPDILGAQGNERTGFGFFWLPGTRKKFVRTRARDDHRLCDPIEDRFDAAPLNYRPVALERHPRVIDFYQGA